MEIVADFESDEKVKSGTVFEVLCSFTAGNYEFKYNYYITIGQSMEDFETGDFSKADSDIIVVFEFVVTCSKRA